jgi:peptide/nickel transport system permease protein
VVAFLVRRVLGMALVLAAVSLVVFMVFVVVPGGDPALRIAGKNATAPNVANIRHDWGFDRPFYVQYGDLMEKAFVRRDLVSYTNQTNVLEQIKLGIPATFSLAIGAPGRSGSRSACSSASSRR